MVDEIWGAESRYILLSSSLFLFASDMEIPKIENKKKLLQQRFWILRALGLKVCCCVNESSKLYKMFHH